jgi:hypothetical protein
MYNIRDVKLYILMEHLTRHLDVPLKLCKTEKKQTNKTKNERQKLYIYNKWEI